MIDTNIRSRMILPINDALMGTQMRWYITDPEARASRLSQILGRRQRNAMARSRGFRNYAQMCGDE